MFKIRWIRRSVRVKTIAVEEVRSDDIEKLFEECREELLDRRRKDGFKAPNGFEIIDPETGKPVKTWVVQD